MEIFSISDNDEMALPALLADSNTYSGTPLVLDSSGIVKNGDFTYTTGTFVPSWESGFSSSQTATWTYVKIGNLVLLNVPLTTGTSNGNSNRLTSIPSQLLPTTSAVATGVIAGGVIDNGISYPGQVVIGTVNRIDFYFQTSFAGAYSNNTYTTSGTKGVNGGTLIYMVN